MVSEVKIEIGGVSRPPAYEAFKSQKSRRTDRRILPELNQAEKSVLDSLGSLQSRRWYRRAMDEFTVLLRTTARTEPGAWYPHTCAVIDSGDPCTF